MLVRNVNRYILFNVFYWTWVLFSCEFVCVSVSVYLVLNWFSLFNIQLQYAHSTAKTHSHNACVCCVLCVCVVWPALYQECGTVYTLDCFYGTLACLLLSIPLLFVCVPAWMMCVRVCVCVYRLVIENITEYLCMCFEYGTCFCLAGLRAWLLVAHKRELNTLLCYGIYILYACSKTARTVEQSAREPRSNDERIGARPSETRERSSRKWERVCTHWCTAGD